MRGSSRLYTLDAMSKDTEVLSARMSKSQAHIVRAIAASRRMSVSDVVREAIERMIDDHLQGVDR